jgi:cobalt-zinc-cadmium efflux system outer membrane protein
MRRLVLELAIALTTLAVSGALAQDIYTGEHPGEPLPSSFAAGSPAALDLTTIEELALQSNPTLVQAGAQVAISRGKALQAGLLPNPQLGYVADQIGADGTAGELQGMFVEQEIVTGGKLRLSRAKYVQEASQAQIQLLAQRYRVLYSVRVAFYDALIWQERVKLLRDLTQNANDAALTVEELLNVGQANKADALQAKIEKRRSDSDLQMAEQRLQGSFEALSAVIGVPELARGELKDSVDLDYSVSFSREELLDNLLACSPELRFARAEVARDQIALERERREPIPNVTLRAETGYNFEVRDTVSGVEVGLNIPLFDRNQGTILQARSEVTRAQAEVARVELLLRRRFAEVYTEYSTSVQTAKTYQEELLPEASEVYKLYEESFRQRRAAWPQVLAAQRDYYQLFDNYLDLVSSARRAEASLNYYLLDDGLSQPLEPTPGGHQDATPKPR